MLPSCARKLFQLIIGIIQNNYCFSERCIGNAMYSHCYFYNSLPYAYIILIALYCNSNKRSDIFDSNVGNADLCYAKPSQIT